MVKHFGWVVRPNTTLVSVKLANGIVLHSSGVAHGLVSSSVLQAYMIFLVLAVLFKVILNMPWLLHVCL